MAQQGRIPTVDKRLAAAGIMMGAAVGAWAGNKARSYAARERDTRLIDWEWARAIAINMNRGNALTTVERSRLDAYYRALVERCVPVVAAYTGTELPDSVERTFAFDRVDWINANLVAFQGLFAPLEALNSQKSESSSVVSVLWGGANRAVVSAELGVLLGYLARRVLGQYDMALLGREPVDAGKLYYVEPNIAAVEQSLGLPSEDFRMWLALHETTHAFEFEAYPWVKAHFNGLLTEYMEFLKADAEHLNKGFRGIKIFVDRARTKSDEQASWLEAIMTPEQRALFQKMQALMCIIEGYSNHVMNAVGRDLLPNYERIARRFEARQRQRTVAEQLFARLTGLNLKMEQYRLGEIFIDTIAKERGHDVAQRVWDGPEYLPTMEEIRNPSLWLQRFDAMSADQVASVGSAASL
jgi:coenzyme F420 biosynthesis associated uncharacterized protein